MAIYFNTSDPTRLLKEFKKKIDSKSILTWSYDQDGDFTHTPTQWIRKAWLRPKIENGKLALYILNPLNTHISTEVYAVYHGRFIESVLVHCDSLFSDCLSTAMPTTGDNVK